LDSTIIWSGYAVKDTKNYALRSEKLLRSLLEVKVDDLNQAEAEHKAEKKKNPNPFDFGAKSDDEEPKEGDKVESKDSEEVEENKDEENNEEEKQEEGTLEAGTDDAFDHAEL